LADRCHPATPREVAARARRSRWWIGCALFGLVFVAGALPGLVYGFLDLLAPQITIRWQVKSTARHPGIRQDVGNAFQKWFRIDPTGEPWDDERVRRKVRLLGGGLLLINGGVIAAGVVLAWAS
jgi:hypothetical protein